MPFYRRDELITMSIAWTKIPSKQSQVSIAPPEERNRAVSGAQSTHDGTISSECQVWYPNDVLGSIEGKMEGCFGVDMNFECQSRRTSSLER